MAPTRLDPRPDPKIAVEGRPAPHLREAVEAGGGRATPVADATGLVWADPRDGDGLAACLAEHGDHLDWVQLPFAGIEPFLPVLDHDRAWTCGKGVYAEPVAEHALALLLAGFRHTAGYAREQSWSGPVGRNVLGARVVVLGGGEITTSFLRLLGPFGCHVTVVRRRPDPVEGADRVVTPDHLDEVVVDTDALVLALALTPETEGVVDRRLLARLPDHAWIINVARGGHVVTGDLVDALRAGTIGGAALDVTDPEPLPDGHPLWSLPNVLITPHIANTPEMGAPLLARRVRENVQRYAIGEELLGPVDVDAGY